jgi:SAM-dependent methyltransferase
MALSERCRVCGASNLQRFLSLGNLPLANAFLAKERLLDEEPTYPLDLVFCARCALVQITETVAANELFRDYAYFSSFSDTMLAHAKSLVDGVLISRALNGESLVVEIASNDGYLLQYYKQRGVAVLGVEPARNIAEVAEAERNIPTICDFFSNGLAASLSSDGKRADVIHAHNVLAHVADLVDFVCGIRTLLKDDGVAIIEVPYIRDLVEQCEFDTIYHEHLCYFSLTSLQHLFSNCELGVQAVERLPIHGGSLRLWVGRLGRFQPSESVTSLLEQEAALGLNDFSYYLNFGDKVEGIKKALGSLLRTLRQQGKRIAGYGAAAKGAVLLNYCNIGAELDFVVDRNPHKQDLYMPGVHLPVLAPAQLLEAMPDYTLLLAWNLAEEVMAQQSEYRRRGGHFIIPIPQVKIV